MGQETKTEGWATRQLGIDCQIGYTATEDFRVQFDKDIRSFPEESAAKDFLNAFNWVLRVDYGSTVDSPSMGSQP